jgi:kynurenine formamidase
VSVSRRLSHTQSVTWLSKTVLLSLLCYAAQILPLHAEETWVDLTHSFSESTIFWPTETGFRLMRGTNTTTAQGYYYAANRFSTAEHGGTHLDAPRHFSASGQTADAIPLRNLIGEAAVVDVSAACATNPDYQITIDDLMDWETDNKQQLVDRIVLLQTGWSQHWPDRLSYLGTDMWGPTAVKNLRFPGLSPTAAKWLVEHRRPKAIGIDTASIDYGQSSDFAAHIALCGANIPIFENVAKLHRLPASGCLVVALPMKIADGSGGPLRIVGRITTNHLPNGE